MENSPLPQFKLDPQPEPKRIEFEENHKELVIAFQEHLTKADSSIAAILSATEEFKKKYSSQLSALPSHPYEKYKQMYLDPAEPILTYEQIPYPTCYCPLTIMSEITAISKHYSDQLIAQMPYVRENENEIAATMFTTLCGDKCFTDKEKMKKHFEFMEILKNLDDRLIETDPLTTSYTLLNHFIRVYKP